MTRHAPPPLEAWQIPPRARRRHYIADLLLLAVIIGAVLLVCTEALPATPLDPPTDGGAEAEAAKPAEAEGPDEGPEAELLQQAATAIVAAIQRENWSWFECGQITPLDQYDERAMRIARALRTALLEVGLKHPNYLWASLAIMWQESHGNPCPLGPNSRAWAERKKLVKQKHLVHWTAEDALAAFRGWEASRRKIGLDAGLGQTIWPFNAHILEADGTVRTATPEEMITVEGSARTLAYHLFENAQIEPRRPWRHWPGIPRDDYAAKLEAWVKSHGGPALTGRAAWKDGGPADVGTRQYTRR